ncbi:MAG: fibronectin type III-like domain-contianing protein, partial [Pseudomonadota bacterium]|nr:fibronectin type III-like domain-contianing protein [Pseudomonadota bacterium]
RFASVVQPVQKLIDFNKITLAAGESRSISFTIKPQQMTFIARDLSQQLESGEFRVWIAPSARAGEAVSFILS